MPLLAIFDDASVTFGGVGAVIGIVLGYAGRTAIGFYRARKASQLEEFKTKHDAELADYKTKHDVELAGYRAKADVAERQWEKLFDEALKIRDDLRGEIIGLKVQFGALQDAHVLCQAENASLHAQVEEMRTENTKLRQQVDRQGAEITALKKEVGLK